MACRFPKSRYAERIKRYPANRGPGGQPVRLRASGQDVAPASLVPQNHSAPPTGLESPGVDPNCLGVIPWVTHASGCLLRGFYQTRGAREGLPAVTASQTCLRVANTGSPIDCRRIVYFNLH